MWKRIHRAWLILAGLCLTFFISVGFSSNVVGLYFTTISNTLDGVRYGPLSLSITAQSIAGMFGITVGAIIVERIPIRKVLTTATIIFACCRIANSFFTKAWQWSVTAFVTGICEVFLGNFTIAIILSNWFRRRQSLSMGLVAAAASLSGAVLNPVISAFIDAFGWRNAYRIEAGVLLLVLLPIYLLLVCMHPSELGMTAYGAETEEENDQTNPAKEESHMDLGLIPEKPYYKNAVFYQFCLTAAVSTMLCCLSQHIISAAVSLGLKRELGVTAVSLYMMVAALIGVIGGALIDRFGYLRVCVVLFGCPGIGMLILLLYRPVDAPVFLVAICFGAAGHSLLYSAMPAWARSEFSTREFGRVYAIFQMVSWGVYAATVSMFGLIYDHLGSFVPVFFILALASAATIVLLLLTHHSSHRGHARLRMQCECA